MEASVECTHCGVVMTSWSAPGSPIRYYQCPFCARTHSSLYGEVFRRRAGARLLDAAAARPAPAAAGAIPMPSPDDLRWTRVKASAARWFERLQADERQNEAIAPHPLRQAPRAADVPEADPRDVVEVRPAARVVARKR